MVSNKMPGFWKRGPSLTDEVKLLLQDRAGQEFTFPSLPKASWGSKHPLIAKPLALFTTASLKSTKHLLHSIAVSGNQTLQRGAPKFRAGGLDSQAPKKGSKNLPLGRLRWPCKQSLRHPVTENEEGGPVICGGHVPSVVTTGEASVFAQERGFRSGRTKLSSLPPGDSLAQFGGATQWRAGQSEPVFHGVTGGRGVVQKR